MLFFLRFSKKIILFYVGFVSDLSLEGLHLFFCRFDEELSVIDEDKDGVEIDIDTDERLNFVYISLRSEFVRSLLGGLLNY